MASDPRRQRVVLYGLLAVLAIVAWWQFGPSGAAPPAGRAAAARPAAPGARQTTTSPAETLAEGVALDLLGGIPALPSDSGRDPFMAGGGSGPDDGGGGVTSTPTSGVPLPVSQVPVAPVGPPPPPAITVKFIGIVQRSDVGTVAVLSDGRNVYYGREGEIVDGRWRIVRIGQESLQIEHADGTGRQTVRLSG